MVCIRTIKDLLYFFPRKYEDRSQLSLVKDLAEGNSASLEVTVHQAFMRPLKGRFSKLLEVKAYDKDKQWISLKWFRILIQHLQLLYKKVVLE